MAEGTRVTIPRLDWAELCAPGINSVVTCSGFLSRDHFVTAMVISDFRALRPVSDTA